MREQFRTAPWLGTSPPLPPFPEAPRPSRLHVEMDQGDPAIIVKRNKFFTGGFESQMTVDEAAMILGTSLEYAPAPPSPLPPPGTRLMRRSCPPLIVW